MFEWARSNLAYDPSTGVFTWIVARRGGGKHGDVVGTKSHEYLIVRVGDKNYSLHRLAWLYVFGEWPIGMIDHINGDPTDNRIGNLRDCGHVVNGQNRRKASSNSSSGLLGAHKFRGKWQSLISIGGKRKRLGIFESPELAHEAYIQAKRLLHPGFVA